MRAGWGALAVALAVTGTAHAADRCALDERRCCGPLGPAALAALRGVHRATATVSAGAPAGPVVHVRMELGR